jgi:hypothetical protein
MERVIARKTWRTVEPVHGMIYFAPEILQSYEERGLAAQQGYFATRSAAMGRVTAEVVIATFFNFHPEVVRSAIPAAWEIVGPDAADAVLRRMLPDAIGSAEMDEAASLARTAAEAACQRPEGRPLFAGHAALPWPSEPHLVLWHAQTLLREFRGDGHVAALTSEGLTGCEALVMHAATGEVPAAALQSTRAWPAEEWAAAEESLRTRGWLAEDGSLTDAGRASRQAVEDRTDELAVTAYEPMGEDGCERLRSLARPWSKAIVESGELGFMGRR